VLVAFCVVYNLARQLAPEALNKTHIAAQPWPAIISPVTNHNTLRVVR
jgi:hypothetical protein